MAALGFFDQVEAVLERGLVGHGLGIERGVKFRGKIGFDEGSAQLVTCGGLLQQGEKFGIELRTQQQLMHLIHRRHALHRGQRAFLVRSRHKLPEALRAQMEEGHRQVAPPVQRHDQRPVVRKEIGQIIAWLDQVGRDQSLGKEINDGE